MNSKWLAVVGLCLTVALSPTMSEAKRLGSGGSIGMQRSMPARTAPDAPAAKPDAPSTAAPSTANAAAGAAPAAATPKRSWMGPLAGLAAGLGLAALMSHLGLSEAFGSFLLIALLAVAAVFVVRLLMRRASAGAQPATAMAGGGRATAPTQVAWPAPAQRQAEPASPSSTVAPAVASVGRAFVPASFDSEGFARIAKTIFIRLQAANDSGDLDDLRRFTTPEMFAELRVDLHERGGNTQHTDVVRVDSEVLDVADEGHSQIVSVRFHGEVREEPGAAPVPFDEVWHLSKPHDDSRSWAIAGIEQLPASAAQRG